VLASEGDASPAYWRCVRDCQVTGCATMPVMTSGGSSGGRDNGGDKSCSAVCSAASASATPAALLRLTRWDCAADCRYLCMWAAEGQRRAEWEERDRLARAPPAAAGVEEAAEAEKEEDDAAAKPTPPPAPPPPPPPPPFQTYKYFGKWPFTRVLGAQEIGSVVTSLLNLAAVAHNLVLYTRALKKAASASSSPSSSSPSSSSSSSSRSSLLTTVLRGRHPYPYAILWYTHGLIACNAWLWSAVFHTRDTRLTERLDYFSAGALVAAGLATAVARAAGRWLAPPRERAAKAALAASAAALAWWLSHVRYLALVKFDYGYNMAVCIALGIAQALVWLAFLLVPPPPVGGGRSGAGGGGAAAATAHHPPPPPSGRRPALLFLLAIHAAMLLEVLDFPPLLHALFDAHCLWHAATAPLAYLWWRFLLADVAWVCGGCGNGGGSGGAGAASGAGGGKGLGSARAGSASPGGASSGGGDQEEATVERRRRRM
jgi:post-GPI attachment to proteins factor 3